MRQSFAAFASRLLETGLRADVEKRALKHNVSLRDLYEGDRSSAVVAARRDVYSWLMRTKEKSINEVARLFDRAPNGVWKLVKK